MAIERAFFYKSIRAKLGPLHAGQVNGIEKIFDEWEKRKLTDMRWLANMLGQVYKESASTMQPVRERGSENYLRAKPYYPYVGEGLIQVTWLANFKKFGASHPGDLMQWPIALRALFDGMIKGMFTGVGLPKFFNNTPDPKWTMARNARKIVNGLNCADEVLGYHKIMLAGLRTSS